MVEYKTLGDYPGYRFGSDGSIWSQRSRNGILNYWNKLNPGTNKGGYYYLCIVYRDDKPHGRFLHDLILEAFIGPRPGHWHQYDARHKDDNKKNNNIENLEWCIKKVNGEDRVKHGKAKTNYGENKCNAIITNEIAKKVKIYLEKGFKHKNIAIGLGISIHIVHNISRNKGSQWKHIKI